MIGLDTTAIIDLFRGEPTIGTLFEKIHGPFVSTQVNFIELLFGLDPLNKTHQKEEQYYEDFFDKVRLLPITTKASKRARNIHWSLKRKGNVVDAFDCLVAGILLENGITTIVTRNTKHFERIAGLRVVTY